MGVCDIELAKVFRVTHLKYEKDKDEGIVVKKPSMISKEELIFNLVYSKRRAKDKSKRLKPNPYNTKER